MDGLDLSRRGGVTGQGGTRGAYAEVDVDDDVAAYLINDEDGAVLRLGRRGSRRQGGRGEARKVPWEA